MNAVREADRPGGGALPRWWLIAAAVLPVVLLIGLGVLLALGSDGGSGEVGGSIGSTAPSFELADLDGDPVRLADQRGHPVIVNFWGSWCVPCREEFPLLEDALAAHASDGLVMIGIVYRDNAEAARSFMQSMGADWTTAMDPGETVANEFGIFGAPETFFIDSEGTVVARQIGQLSATDLERHLARLLNEE